MTDEADPHAAAARGAGRASGPVRPLSSNADCLALAAAVLAGVRGDHLPPGATGPGEEGVGRLWQAIDRLPEIAVWIRGAAPPGTADDRGRLLAWLRGECRATSPGGPDGPIRPRPSAEQQTLEAALGLAIDHVRLEERFLDAVGESRIEALRELAYGAGHEINNPLANIATRAQALLLEETDPERRRRLSTIVDQAFRARDMIGGLMIFARPPKPSRGAADTHAIVAAVIDAVRPAAAGRAVRLEYSPAPAPRVAFVDRVQVEEAVRAVVVNAIEGVTPGGRVVIEVRAAAHGDATEIAVTDDGRGMAPEQARRAFDPFYSGREAGRGAGLGLPKAWRLLGVNGGGIALDSRPGVGTRATITLPPVVAPAGEQAAKSAQTAPLREDAPQP